MSLFGSEDQSHEPRSQSASPGIVTNSVWLLPEEKLRRSDTQPICTTVKPEGRESGILVDPARVEVGIQLAVNGLAQGADVKRASLSTSQMDKSKSFANRSAVLEASKSEIHDGVSKRHDLRVSDNLNVGSGLHRS
jgi:hypothetical protein